MQQLIRPLRQRFKQHPMRHPKHARQLGIALLEALMALVILAFGVLGLLWLHQQALAQQPAAVRDVFEALDATIKKTEKP